MLAVFGPTGVGKTGVAISLAEKLRERGEDPVAINCDALQVYEGLGVLTGAATAEEQARLEHRLLSFVPVTERFLGRRLHAACSSGGRRGARGGSNPDRGWGNRPLPASGAGESLAAQGPGRIGGVGAVVARRPATRPGSSASTWTERRCTSGSTPGSRRSSPPAPPRRRAVPTPSARSRTARKALGFDELLAGDIEAMKQRSRNYARRQLTWMRKIPEPDHRSTAPGSATTQTRRPRSLSSLAWNRCHAGEIREVASARQRLPDRRGGEPPLGAELEAGRVALRSALRARLRRRPAARQERRSASSSPSCGSSTRTARRPSSRATGRGRRSSTCAATAGPTRTCSRSRPSAGPITPTITGELTCAVDMGSGLDRLQGLPLRRRGRRRQAQRRRARVGVPARLDRQPAVRDRGRRRARRARPGGDRPGYRRPRAVPQPHQRLLPGDRRQPGAGADLRARGGGDALLRHRRQRRRGDRLSCAARPARSWSSSKAASSRSRSARTSRCG